MFRTVNFLVVVVNVTCFSAGSTGGVWRLG